MDIVQGGCNEDLHLAASGISFLLCLCFCEFISVDISNLQNIWEAAAVLHRRQHQPVDETVRGQPPEHLQPERHSRLDRLSGLEQISWERQLAAAGWPSEHVDVRPCV